jgi:hypothetical protein
MQLEGSGQLKDPVTSSGIEPTTSQLVAKMDKIIEMVIGFTSKI